MPTPPIHTVLTGDLIASRKASDAKITAAMQVLRDTANAICGQDGRFTRFRGDGWQMLVPDPHATFDAALMLLARLRASDLGINTRLSIGIGTVTSRGTSDLSDAAGPAFHASGDGLARMGRRNRIAIAGQGIGPWQIAVIDLVDHLAAGWTAAQAEAVALWLSDTSATHDDMAAHLSITRQAMQSRLASAGVGYLAATRKAFHTCDFTTLADPSP